MKNSLFLSQQCLLLGSVAPELRTCATTSPKMPKFSDYRTYKWVDIKNSDHVNELVQGQIKAALEAELATKGLTKTNSDDADLYIGVSDGHRNGETVQFLLDRLGRGPGLGRRLVSWWVRRHDQRNN